MNLSNTRIINEFILSLNDEIDTEEFQKTLKSFLSKKKGINPNDKTALLFHNVEETVKSFSTLFKIIHSFLWFIGISFLVSGIMAVFNIMTIIVRDRVGEFGVRKAIGASPGSIQIMVMLESLLITLISGVIGLIAGFMLIYFINWYIEINEGSETFLTLNVNIYIIISAILLLSFSGCIAGIIPARKAAKVKPIEALRELNN